MPPIGKVIPASRCETAKHGARSTRKHLTEGCDLRLGQRIGVITGRVSVPTLNASLKDTKGECQQLDASSKRILSVIPGGT